MNPLQLAEGPRLRNECGDYVKVEFPDPATGIGEWMWVRITRCDKEKQLVFGILDNIPLNDYEGNVRLGSEMAVSYSQIREHRKPTEFTRQQVPSRARKARSHATIRQEVPRRRPVPLFTKIKKLLCAPKMDASFGCHTVADFVILSRRAVRTGVFARTISIERALVSPT